MVELLTDFPPHVAAYKASGKISKEEYDGVVKTRVDEVAATYGKINFLVYLETDMENYTVGAFLEYLKVSFEYFKSWERMAIVTNEAWVRKAYELLSPLVHGEIKGFELKEFEAAKQWVSGRLKTD